jgi:hypothetical protein
MGHRFLRPRPSPCGPRPTENLGESPAPCVVDRSLSERVPSWTLISSRLGVLGWLGWAVLWCCGMVGLREQCSQCGTLQRRRAGHRRFHLQVQRQGGCDPHRSQVCGRFVANDRAEGGDCGGACTSRGVRVLLAWGKPEQLGGLAPLGLGVHVLAVGRRVQRVSGVGACHFRPTSTQARRA